MMDEDDGLEIQYGAEVQSEHVGGYYQLNHFSRAEVQPSYAARSNQAPVPSRSMKLSVPSDVDDDPLPEEEEPADAEPVPPRLSATPAPQLLPKPMKAKAAPRSAISTPAPRFRDPVGPVLHGAGRRNVDSYDDLKHNEGKTPKGKLQFAPTNASVHGGLDRPSHWSGSRPKRVQDESPAPRARPSNEVFGLHFTPKKKPTLLSSESSVKGPSTPFVFRPKDDRPMQPVFSSEGSTVRALPAFKASSSGVDEKRRKLKPSDGPLLGRYNVIIC